MSLPVEELLNGPFCGYQRKEFAIVSNQVIELIKNKGGSLNFDFLYDKISNTRLYF